MNKIRQNKEETSTAHKLLTILGTIMCIILIPVLVMNISLIIKSYTNRDEVLICPLSSRQVKYLKVSDKNTYISFWSVGIFMHTISLYIF